MDALDALEDKPEPRETVHLYIRVGPEGASGFLDGRGKDGKRFGRRFTSAHYRLCRVQPPADQVRETEAWRAWVEKNRLAIEREYRENWPEPVKADGADNPG